MRNRLTLILACLPLFLFSQNGIIGSGFTNGWNNPGDILGFSGSAGLSRIITLNPRGTGNQYFRFVKFWDGDNSEYGPFGCMDTDWTTGVNLNYDNMPVCGGGAFYINCPNTTDNYVFKTPGALENDFVYFRVQGAVRTVTNVTSPIGGEVEENVAYEVIATTNDPLNTGQKVWLRYSTDNWGTSTVLEMIEEGGGIVPTDYIASIPGQSAGTTVNYYVLTSGDMASLSGANADWFTINLNNNGGSNYEYSVVAPLAVTLLEFEAAAESDQTKLKWITENEANNSHFEIEKSSDSRNWEVNGKVDGNGDTNEKIDYSFIDKEPFRGLNYYRLKQVDFDGTSTYSEIISVEFKKPSGVSIFPNPVQDVLTVSGTIEMNYGAELYDLNGRILKNEALNSENTSLDMTGILRGVYLLRIIDEAGVVIDSQRIIKL